MQRIFVTVSLILVLATPALAGMKEVVAAYEQEDYVTALNELRPLAEQGNIGAQLFLATLYEDGRGVPRDYVQAYKWYSLTASGGDQTFIILRIRLAQRMTAAQIEDAKKLVREWLENSKKPPGG